MSAHPTRPGRHSLPPSGPSAPRASTASASGGSHLRDGGVGNAKSPLSISISLGNLRGASEGSRSSPAPAGAGSSSAANGSGSARSAAGTTSGTGPKKDKPKKKRGMKGWAWVVEDENGNVVDMPAEEDGRVEKGTQVAAVGEGSASLSGPVEEPQMLTATTATTAADTVLQTPREEEQVVREEVQTPKSQASTAPRDEGVLGKRVYESSPPGADVPAKGPIDIPPSEAPVSTSVDTDAHRSKVRRKESPAPVTITPAPIAIASPTPAAPTTPVVSATAITTPSTAATPITAPPAPILTSTAPTPTENATPNPTAPPPLAKGTAARRTQPSRQPLPAARVRAQIARDREVVSRAGSAHVVDDDSPLAVPPPRAGLADGSYAASPRELALKEEMVLFQEALLMIDEAEKHREMSYEPERGSKNGRGRGGRNRDLDGTESDEDDWDSDVGPSRRRRKRPGHSSGKVPPASHSSRSFEEQWDSIQTYYRHKSAEARAVEAREPPDLSRTREPVVVVATNPREAFPKDRVEKGYQNGMSGVTAEMEADAQGFIANVRSNLTAITTYYFPQRSMKRDAFLERIGRGLQRLGEELTDNGDSAVLP
ncbi:hypothetical protein IAR50_000239 [Cryptococcus sp. DSM 104548]